MKTSKCLPLLLSLLLLAALTGCSEENMLQYHADNAAFPLSVETESEDTVDIDLTKLSSTLAFSELYNIMLHPEEYVEKSIKITGEFSVFEEDPYSGEGEPYYYAVIISDATACCQRGITFAWNGSHSYPEDYPPAGAEITIYGVYEPYENGENTYYHLVTDNLSMIQK